MTSILVVDDHEAVRRQIAVLLHMERDLNVVAEASNAIEAIQQAEHYQPDIILLDISMPEVNGLQAIPHLQKAAPSAEILVLTQYDNLFFVREAFITGAAGFLVKSDVLAELVVAVREVSAGRSFVSKSIASPAHDPVRSESASPQGAEQAH